MKHSVKICVSLNPFFCKTQAVFVFLLSHQLLARLLTQTRTSERLGKVLSVCVCVYASMGRGLLVRERVTE